MQNTLPVAENEDPSKEPFSHFNEGLRQKLGVEERRVLLRNVQNGAAAIIDELENAIGSIPERFRPDYRYVHEKLEQGRKNVQTITDITAVSLDVVLSPVIEAQYTLALPPASIAMNSPLVPREVLDAYKATKNTGLLVDVSTRIRSTRRDALAFYQLRTLLAVARGKSPNAAVEVTALMPQIYRSVVNLKGYSKEHLESEDVETIISESMQAGTR